MADPNRPGVETSEHGGVQKFLRYTVAIAATASAAIIALLATKVIPESSTIFAVLSVTALVLGAIGGGAVATNKYTGGRTALKLAKLGMDSVKKLTNP